MRRTTARALTVVTSLALAGAVAGAGTLTSSNAAAPAVSTVAYTVTPAAYDDSAALAARTAARATFAQRASRDARHAAHLKALRSAKAKAARVKAARAHAGGTTGTTRVGRRTSKHVAHLYAPPVVPGSARALGKKMAAARGWTGDQWVALDRLWGAESGWSTGAANSAGAYGIPQALPGSKMSSAGGDWRNSARTQIAWGLNYIAGRWGTPMAAWNHFLSYRWY